MGLFKERPEKKYRKQELLVHSLKTSLKLDISLVYNVTTVQYNSQRSKC